MNLQLFESVGIGTVNVNIKQSSSKHGCSTHESFNKRNEDLISRKSIFLLFLQLNALSRCKRNKCVTNCCFPFYIIFILSAIWIFILVLIYNTYYIGNITFAMISDLYAGINYFFLWISARYILSHQVPSLPTSNNVGYNSSCNFNQITPSFLSCIIALIIFFYTVMLDIYNIIYNFEFDFHQNDIPLWSMYLFSSSNLIIGSIIRPMTFLVLSYSVQYIIHKLKLINKYVAQLKTNNIYNYSYNYNYNHNYNSKIDRKNNNGGIKQSSNNKSSQLQNEQQSVVLNLDENVTHKLDSGILNNEDARSRVNSRLLNVNESEILINNAYDQQQHDLNLNLGGNNDNNNDNNDKVSIDDGKTLVKYYYDFNSISHYVTILISILHSEIIFESVFRVFFLFERWHNQTLINRIFQCSNSMILVLGLILIDLEIATISQAKNLCITKGLLKTTDLRIIELLKRLPIPTLCGVVVSPKTLFRWLWLVFTALYALVNLTKYIALT